MLLQLLKEYLVTACLYLDHVVKQHPDLKWQTGKQDVLLLQGVNCPWNFMRKIGNSLSSHGYRIHVVEELQTNKLPIEQCAEIIKKYIISHNLKYFAIVTHSKSSLTAKYLLDFYPEISSKITKIITVAAPFNGSILASIGGNLKELKANSPVIKKLKDITKNNSRIVSIYPKIDNHVIPNSSSHLEGAENLKVNVIGHTNMLVDNNTIKLIQEKLTNSWK